MKISITPDEKSPGTVDQYDLTLDDLKGGILKIEVGPKAGDAFIPAVFDPPYRSNANVKEITCFVADLDHLEEGALELVVDTLRTAGLDFFWYHTHTFPNARLLVTFKESYAIRTPIEWSQVAWPAIVKHLGLNGVIKADQSCRDPARLYYQPRKPSADSPHRSGYIQGTPLDVAAILKSQRLTIELNTSPKVTSPADLAPYVVSVDEDPSRPVDLNALRTRLMAKRDSLGAKLAKGIALSPPPALRRQGDLARHMAWFHACGALSMQAEPWMASEALLEICKPSWQAEVATSPEDHTPWDGGKGVVDLLRQQRMTAPIKKAEMAAEQAKVKSLWEKILVEKFTPADSSNREPSDPEVDPAGPARDGANVMGASSGAHGGPQLSASLHGAELLAALELTAPKSEEDEPRLIKSLKNLNVLLRESFWWKGAFRKNLLNGNTEIHAGPLFMGKVSEFKNENIADVRHWLVAEFGADFSRDDINDYVELAARDWAYDPIANYLRALKWDQTPRLDTMLENYFKAEVVDDYTGPVGAKWMISAVARALDHGCQVDTMLVLQGQQGIRKSTAVRVLGGAGFSDFDYDMSSDEARGACSENWILEVGELSSMTRSQRDAVKQFISKKADKFRAKYARRQDNHPRRCVFIGTTNEEEIFQDETGNRRFWPVNCVGQIDTDGLARDRDQLWAEALARYEAGEKWHLEARQEVTANKETSTRLFTDVVTDKVTDWILRYEPGVRPFEVRIIDVVTHALADERLPDRSMQSRVGASLKRMGFARYRKTTDGVSSYYYKLPDNLRVAPKRTRVSLGGDLGGGPNAFASA
mgnify:CR=1 FL=1